MDNSLKILVHIVFLLAALITIITFIVLAVIKIGLSGIIIFLGALYVTHISLQELEKLLIK